MFPAFRLPRRAMLHAPASRWTAFLLHLLLSGLVIGSIVTAVVLLWFPAGLYRVANLGKLFEVMLAVDVTAGPLLTLLVYRRGKPSLRFDLAVIAVLQLAFLAYGMHTLWRGRPVFLVGSSEAFALVFANEIPADVTENAAKRGWHRFHGTGPWLVGVDTTDTSAQSSFLNAYLQGELGPLADTERYVPYEKVAADVARVSHHVKQGSSTQPPSLPLMSARSIAVMLVDAEGRPLRAVP